MNWATFRINEGTEISSRMISFQPQVSYFDINGYEVSISNRDIIELHPGKDFDIKNRAVVGGKILVPKNYSAIVFRPKTRFHNPVQTIDSSGCEPEICHPKSKYCAFVKNDEGADKTAVFAFLSTLDIIEELTFLRGPCIGSFV